jgi:hypothetical protein
LSSIGKPVVLCGSPLSQVEARTASAGGADFGTKASFINAVQVAVSDISGVLVVYGSHMYRGETLVGPMHRAHGDVIGKIDFGIRFFGQHQRRHDRSWSVSSSFDTHVAVAEYLPGVDLRTVVHIPRGTKAVFISSAEGAGPMPKPRHKKSPPAKRPASAEPPKNEPQNPSPAPAAQSTADSPAHRGSVGDHLGIWREPSALIPILMVVALALAAGVANK